MKLGTVICYCTIDERFIRDCLNAAIEISDEVVVPVSSHLYDSTPENLESINNLSKEYPSVVFKVFDWLPGHHPRYWHNTSRVIGNSLLSNDIDWVLFIDSDEMVEPKPFKKFIDSDSFNSCDSYKLGCYWYFREKNIRAKTLEDSPVLVRRELVNINVNDLCSEREQLHEHLSVPKQRMILLDGQPFIHHYSWVRTKEQMLQKVKAWGHSSDRDWVALIEEEFSRPFNGKCFVHDYIFEII